MKGKTALRLITVPTIFIALCAMPLAATAVGSAVSAKVVGVQPENNGTISGYFVYVNEAPAGAAACATATDSLYRFVIDSSTQVGMTMVATALTAYATGGNVDIYGLGTCAIWPDTETVERIYAH